MKSNHIYTIALVALLFLGNCSLATAQSMDRNYIQSKMFLVPSKLDTVNTIGSVQKSINYYDGLGRLSQSIAVGTSPDKKDVVTSVAYDIFGRQDKNYLPYKASSSGNFVENAIFMQQQYYNAIYPGKTTYAKTVYEESPLGKVIEQVSPGNNQGGRSTKFNYNLNGTNDQVIFWKVNSTNNLIKSGYYQPSTLYKNEIKDENYNVSIEYKNTQGQVVLLRSYSTTSQKHDTYYVYDDFGLLRYVLSPMASYNMTANSYTPETEIVKRYCYYYEYNKRKLMIKKQLPGAGYVTMEYDNRDRLIYSIDANQREKVQKIKIEYDNLNRPTKRLLYYPITTNPTNPKSTETEKSENGKGDLPYNPEETCVTLEITQYDDYNGVPSQLAFANVSGMGQYFVKSDKVRGLVTYNKKKSLDVEDLYIETAMYYDKYGRLIQSVSTNHLGGIDRVSNDLDFSGKVLKTVTQHHTEYLSEDITLKEVYSYDHAGRLLTTKLYLNNLSFNGNNVSSITYDDLGRVSKKGFLQSGSVTYKQYQKFQYNIRGWLTHINNPDSLGSAYFAQKLLYETGTNAQHNGNISAEEWRSPGLTQKYRYDYQYDGLNRIKNASFTPASRYNMSWSYDLNGNILNQKRSGKPQDQSFGSSSEFMQVEDLYYAYRGNQLLSVNNNLIYQLPNGFKDNSEERTEYFYDANGNLIKDLNQNIENIDYNFLNLPSQIEMADIDGISKNNFMQYHYLSDGQKLSQKVFTNGEVSTTRDYCGRFVYENGKLSYIIHADGVVRAIYSTPGGGEGQLQPEMGITIIPTDGGEVLSGFTREIHLKDHLGNVRAVFDYSKLQSENHYYPFGLPIHNLCTSTALQGKENRYLYNGKELQDDLGLNWMDYGARFYDAGIGRFHSKDRFEENYFSLSPYQYTANNPIRFVDVNGDYIYIYGPYGDRYKYDEGKLYIYDDDNKEWVENTPEEGSFVQTIFSALNQLSEGGVAAKSLIDFFGNEKNNTIIRQNPYKNENSNNGTFVNIDPLLKDVYLPTTDGMQQVPLYISLAHEMAHCQDQYLRGDVIPFLEWYSYQTVNGQKKIPISEQYATHIENQIRSQNGLPLRTHYGIVGETGSGYEPSRIINDRGESLFYNQTIEIQRVVVGANPSIVNNVLKFTVPFTY